MPREYIIGTRGSLLAVAQCELLRDQLEAKTGLKFILKKIKTEGDLKTEKPLWQMDGKDFFTKELDHALKNNEVDLVVHSYKDLGSDRPSEFDLAAITERKFGEDILLINQNKIQNIKDTETFIVGTSSPRRIVNIENNLGKYLPGFKGEVKTKMLRGNVNTRIQKLKDGDYDAIVLAFAGLERLASHPEASKTLQDLLKDLNYLILPQSQFPSASSQGALAVEICKGNPEYKFLKENIAKVADPKTTREMSIEREIFASYGGGCHLAVGIEVKEIEKEKFIIFERGESGNKQINSKRTHNISLPGLKSEESFFLGFPDYAVKGMKLNHPKIVCDEIVKKVELELNQDLNQKNLFLTSKYTLNALDKNIESSVLWVSGDKTHKRVIEKGHWVNGSADSLGGSLVKNYLDSNLINLFNPRQFETLILTAQNSNSEFAKVIPCYTREQVNPSDQFKTQIENTKHFYWTSYPQFEIYCHYFPFLRDKDAGLSFYTGFGKTYKEFIKRDLHVNPIYSLSEFFSS